MGTTFTVGLKGKTEKAQGGLGAKIVEGEITGVSEATAASIAAKDLGLKTLYNLQVVGYTTGTHYTVKLGTFTPGDNAAANYASVTAYGGTTGAQVAVKLGTFRVWAFGE